MEENKFRSGGVLDNNGNLDKHLNLFTISILNLEPDNIVSVFAEGACDITSFVIKLEFRGDIDRFKLVGRDAVGNVDLDVQFIVLVVGEEVLLFWLKLAGS